VAAVFRQAGFRVRTEFLGRLAYRYVASPRARALLPIYNAVDSVVFALPLMKALRPFVLTRGEKP
jgi:hypothetical protein